MSIIPSSMKIFSSILEVWVTLCRAKELYGFQDLFLLVRRPMPLIFREVPLYVELGLLDLVTWYGRVQVFLWNFMYIIKRGFTNNTA